jgi:hypothetical protein
MKRRFLLPVPVPIVLFAAVFRVWGSNPAAVLRGSVRR